MLTTVQDFPTVYIWVSFLSQIERCMWLIIIGILQMAAISFLSLMWKYNNDRSMCIKQQLQICESISFIKAYSVC